MTRSRRRKLQRLAASHPNRSQVRMKHLLTTVPLAPALLAGSHVASAQQTTAGGLEEIIVTAQKREESLQAVPLSIQAIGTERLDQLQVKEFEDYVKYLPSVSFTSIGPGFSLPYFRGVASGENNNHSGPSPSVGMYLDEQPITTIQGALDIHMYDIARVEALAGPQGTLYGASSQAGTIRIITNKPDPSGFEAGYGVEGNTMSEGGSGYVVEGFVNMPISDATAIRLVGWARHDPGYIDNVPGTRTYATSGGCISNTKTPPDGCVSTPMRAKKNFNDVDVLGGRAALRIDLGENWSITPTVMAQKQDTNGIFAYAPKTGDLEVTQYYPDYTTDKWVQAALTVEGRIGNFDVVYAGAYLKRDDVVDYDYSDYTYFYDLLYGSGAYWTDNDGNVLLNPSQYVHGPDGYTRQSHEIRITSPQDRRLRFVGGLFYEKGEHKIFQRYKIDGLATDLSVPGFADTIWLTNQLRKDQDQAIFGELSFDFTKQLTGTVGLRYFETEGSLFGFFGYNENYFDKYGTAKCFSPKQYNGNPCTNLDGKVTDDGTVPRVNLTYRYDDQKLFYATYSEGFRPGGVNRNDGTTYKPDYLKNYEAGWKTTWAGGSLRLNGAIFYEEWDDIQYSFLPPEGVGLTVIRNAGAAEIKGIEVDLSWAATDALTVTAGATALNAELSEDYIADPEEGPAAFKGDQLPVTPDFKGNVVARYQFGLGDFAAHAQAGVVYTGSSWSDLTRADRAIYGKQPSYTTADFSFGLQRSNYSIEMYVNNAFDERGRVTTYSGCTADTCGAPPDGLIYYVPITPRTIGIKFSQDF